MLTGRSGYQTVIDRKHIPWLQQIGGYNYNLTSKTLKHADCFWVGGVGWGGGGGGGHGVQEL